jgi:hypothetical protein
VFAFSTGVYTGSDAYRKQARLRFGFIAALQAQGFAVLQCC